MMDHPVEMHKKKSPLWFYILLLIPVIGIALGFSGKFFDRNISSVVEGHLEKLRANQLTQAYYDYTSQEFQKTTSLEAFREFVSFYPVLLENKTFILHEQDHDAQSGDVKGILISKQMHEMDADYKLVRENNHWKILSIRLKEPLRGEQLDSVLKELAQKAEEQLKMLRKENVIDAYYGFFSKEFQKETPIQVFKDFVKSNSILTNYTGLKLKDSKIQSDKGIIQFILTSQDGEFLLEDKMVREGNDWKIWSLKVVLSPEEAAKQASTNPEALIPPVRELLDALLLQKIEQAYVGTAKEFQETTSLASFKTFIVSNPVFTRRDLADYKAGIIENGVGKLRVNLHDQEGLTAVEFKLGFEDHQWKIWSMQVVNKPHGLVNDDGEIKDEIAMAEVVADEPVLAEGDTRVGKIIIGKQADSKGIVQSSMVVIDPDEPKIYINVALEEGHSGAKVSLYLTHIDSDTTAPVQSVQLEKSGDSIVSFSYAAPKNGWPEGTYVVKAVASTGQEAIQKFQMRQDEKDRY